MEDANGNRSDFTYDGHDRFIKLNFPSTTVGAHSANSSDYEEYGYDPAGNMTSKRLRSGEAISFTYDVLNRETVKDIPGGTSADVYSGYDLLGRKLFAKFQSTSGDGVVYTYDALARILSETSYGRALTFQYDLASNRTRITHPDSNYIQTTYDVLNRALEVRENDATSGAGLLAAFAYDNAGRRSTTSFGNQTATTYNYDTDSRDRSLTQELAGVSQDLTISIAYSTSSQLLSRDISNSIYAYTPPTLSKSYTANGLNQYTAVGGTTFTNDARGNLTSDGSRTFAYDLENHLTSVSGAASITLTYDPLGRLHETVSGSATTQFLYDGDRLVAEYDGSNNLLRRYAHSPGVDEPLVWYEGSGLTDRRTHHADNQGSIIATSDGSGSGTIQTYGPYGEPSSWSGSRFKFTGQIAIPEASLYHYKARVYDPIAGRFLQTDPIGYESGMNLYAYAANSPSCLIDPLGLYYCAGSVGDCRKVEKFYETLKKAKKGLRPGSDGAKKLDEILKYLGAPGEANGVFVQPTDLAPGSLANSPEENLIEIDVRQIEKLSVQYQPGNPRMSREDLANGVGAGYLAHEGRHQLDFRRLGYPQTKQEALRTELNAYRTQAFSDEGLRMSSGLWYPGISAAEQMDLIYGAARMSVANFRPPQTLQLK